MLVEPLVSVIMSVYNGGAYLSEAIESVLNQTFDDFEFIIINDGSVDDSLEVIKKYARKDKRIVIISRENRGLIASLNEGISKAQGKYIARMDADDISLPKRFDKQLEILESRPDIVVCGSWTINIYENGKYGLSKFYINDSSIKANLVQSCSFAHPSVMIRASTLKENTLLYQHEYLHAEDYALWVSLSLCGEFYNIPQPLLKYRVLKDSVTRTADKNEEQRKYTYTKIQSKVFENIGYQYTNKDLDVMFILSHKERIKNNLLNFKEVNALFKRVCFANEKSNFCSQQELKGVLGRRLVLYFIIKRDLRCFLSKYFFYGVYSTAKRKFGVL